MTAVGSWLNLSVHGFLAGCNWDGTASVMPEELPSITETAPSPLRSPSSSGTPNSQGLEMSLPVQQFFQGILWDGSGWQPSLELAPEISPVIPAVSPAKVDLPQSDLALSNGHRSEPSAFTLDRQAAKAINGQSWLNCSVSEFLAGCNWLGEAQPPETIALEPSLSRPEPNLSPSDRPTPAVSTNGFVPETAAELVGNYEMPQPISTGFVEEVSGRTLQDKVTDFFQSIPWDGLSAPSPVEEAQPTASPAAPALSAPVSAPLSPVPISREGEPVERGGSDDWLSHSVQQFLGGLSWDGSRRVDEAVTPGRDRATPIAQPAATGVDLAAPAPAISTRIPEEMGLEVRQFFQAIPWNGKVATASFPEKSVPSTPRNSPKNTPPNSSSANDPIHLAEMF